MKQTIAVILAAGEGKRMKSRKSKVVHKIFGKSLIEWIYTSVKEAGIDESIVVVGHRADQVIECMGDRVKYAEQKQQLGTGHAVMQAEEYFKDKDGYVLVLYGDTPLVTSKTLKDVIEFHENNGCSATVITAEVDDPTGYGRIIRDGNGNVIKIVEQKDASSEEAAIKEINSGMYCFTIEHFVKALRMLNNDNNQGEYYITDTIGILVEMGHKVGALKLSDPREILGINDRVQLFEASEIIKARIMERHMRSGVTIIDPASTYIDEGVEIGIDTVIYPGTILEGNTRIGEDCIIGPDSRLVNAVIGDGTEVNHSVILDSSVGNNTHVGPFAYVRPGSSIGDKVKIGDFVEIKKAEIGDKTKISHLTYVGDAQVGRNVNIGCGVVTVNYDGKKKHKTIIGDNAFVGCNVNLVAPVVVENDTYIAAGSTITDDVPQNSLAIARERQTIKDGWVIRKGMQRKE
ncbi:MAG TPA: bifunctional UDP-N-acetylglucosamine diphosphorylase/glucosamine-1-phosphate N-acetyltransferase GlmU [Clostridiaceae bacterium]|nr:bifunctional UDP-N-acetylglucosamine diphosphorylase/glucosamine-1-phosphate N-acetyltransferase GlmU [Clostridiaceae bacterium]